jgi:hypothetical protein
MAFGFAMVVAGCVAVLASAWSFSRFVELAPIGISPSTCTEANATPHPFSFIFLFEACFDCSTTYFCARTQWNTLACWTSRYRKSIAYNENIANTLIQYIDNLVI